MQHEKPFTCKEWKLWEVRREFVISVNVFNDNDCCCYAAVFKTNWLHTKTATLAEYLWKDSHLTPSQSTTPDVISSSAKYSVSMPSSSCFLNWIPEVVRSSMESCAYMSSLITNTFHTVMKDNQVGMKAEIECHYHDFVRQFWGCCMQLKKCWTLPSNNWKYVRENTKVILREVKLEVELPCWCSWRVFPLFVHKREAQLDYLEQVHITAQ